MLIQKSYLLNVCFSKQLTLYVYKFLGHNNTKVCGLKSAPCLQKAEDELNKLELEGQILKSYANYCDCKPSCSKLGYSVELSLSDVSWQDFFNAQDNLDVIFNPEQTFFSVLSIYFKEEQFLPIVRSELYGVTDLISNFGGLLGLFTGFSLISCVEIIYYFTIRVFYNLKLYGKWYGLEHN